MYLLNPLVAFYASYSRAVEPTTPLVSILPASLDFSLQPRRQWETGSKATVLGGRIDATAAYFQINKNDILTQTIIDNVRVQQQIGEQRARGVELSVSARPYSTLQVMTDVTFLDDAYLEFNENQTRQPPA